MYLSDTVVPRNRLPQILSRVYAIAESQQIKVANVFHAGDGNLHPILLYDGRNSEETHRMLTACEEIMQACLDVGGSLSGEHGIGYDKRSYMNRQFTSEDLGVMSKLKRAFDPQGICNPEKVLPSRAACGEAGIRDFSRLPSDVWV